MVGDKERLPSGQQAPHVIARASVCCNGEVLRPVPFQNPQSRLMILLFSVARLAGSSLDVPPARPHFQQDNRDRQSYGPQNEPRRSEEQQTSNN